MVDIGGITNTLNLINQDLVGFIKIDCQTKLVENKHAVYIFGARISRVGQIQSDGLPLLRFTTFLFTRFDKCAKAEPHTYLSIRRTPNIRVRSQYTGCL